MVGWYGALGGGGSLFHISLLRHYKRAVGLLTLLMNKSITDKYADILVSSFTKCHLLWELMQIEFSYALENIPCAQPPLSFFFAVRTIF